MTITNRQVDFSTVKSPRTLLPAGSLLFEIEGVTEERTREGQYLMYKFDMRVAEPVSEAGSVHGEYCVIGTPDDPDGDQQATWDTKAGRLKLILERAAVPMDGDLESIFAAATGHQLIGLVEQYIEPDVRRDGTPNQNAGQLAYRISRWYARGEQEIGLHDASKNGPKPTAAKPAVPAAKAPIAAKPAAPKPAAPAAKPAAPAAAKPAAKATPTAAPKRTIPCGICGQQIPRDEFQAHVEGCEGTATEAEE